MTVGLAERTPAPSTADAARIAFATLVGPVRPTRRHTHRPAGSQRHLLATVAHELRNPLASLRLSLEMLVDDFEDLEPAAALSLLRRAQRTAAWLHALTENLSSTSCIEAGRLDVRPEQVDVCECMEAAVLVVHGLMEQRGQTVRFSSSSPTTVAVADPTRVVQVIVNLLSNASRFSREGDEVELHLSMVGHHLRVRVTDHGPGISPEDQQRIFGAWVRGEGSSAGGLGLGLSIVQSLVQQQGGRVGVESTLGQGASFWFTLPLASALDLEASAACRH